MSNVSVLSGAKVSDIPAMLRRMAEQIEAGDVSASSMLVIIPRDQDWPEIFGWGENLGYYGNMAVCELAKAWFVENKTVRR